ncbi:MAG: serine protease, partial [Armatimonadetes bacterium]|nr:serine protease [Armatimonadota bacterium]
ADAFSLGERVRTSTPGAVLQCEVWRDGRRLTLPVRLGSRSLWPEVDELEFKQAWQQLGAVLPAGQQEQLLCLWDWQTRTPVAAQLPPTIELLFRRTAPLESTTFLFRGVPASP